MNTNTTLSKGSWIPLNQRRATRTGILLLLLWLLSLPCVMQAQFNYTINNGSITITGYTGPGGDVGIPSTIDGLPVTSIVDWAFQFSTSLTNVTIPNSVTNIGTDAFFECDNLTAITVDVLNPVFSSVDGVVFNKSQTALIKCPNGIAGSYTIPDSVTGIGDKAFRYCLHLTGVTIGTNVTSIADWAFGECNSLLDVTIPNSATSIGLAAFYFCNSLTNVTIGDSVTSIGMGAFYECHSLTRVTIGTNVTSIGMQAFFQCGGLTNVTIPNSVTSIGYQAFFCSLTSVTIPYSVTSIGVPAFAGSDLSAITVDTNNPAYSSVAGVLFNKSQTTLVEYPAVKADSYTIPNGVTSIGTNAFYGHYSLTNVTIPNSLTYIGDYAFCSCGNLRGIYFQGNAPSLGGPCVFEHNNATVYYVSGTTGWGATFGGRPTALWTPANPPTIQTSPQTQTTEAGSAVGLRVHASGSSPLWCMWYLNSTNLLSCSTNRELDLTNVQFSQSGAYTVVISNASGTVTSAPALLNVIAAVERRPVPGVKVTGATASLWNLDYADTLSPAPNWTTLGSVNLTSTPQYCFDLTLPLPPQRFYRAWQTGNPGVRPSLDLHPVPAITLTGTIGHSVRLDYINQFGPTDAWVTLATVPLTNTSQLYFDISAPGQPPRLYRLVPSP